MPLLGSLELDRARGCAVVHGREVPLRPLDLRLLAVLIRHPDRVHSREALVEALWGPDRSVDPRAIDTSVARLRSALNSAGRAIVTVRRVGYRLDADVLLGDEP